MRKNYELSDVLVHVNFQGKNSQHKLTYRLYKHSVVEKWLQLMKKSSVAQLGIQNNGVFYGDAVNNKVEVQANLDAIVDHHNDFCRKNGLEDCIIPIKTDNPPTQERLNKLHEYFEAYADDPRFQKPESHPNLLQMNLNIHKLESCLYDPLSSHVEVLCDIVMGVPFEDHDYTHFSPNYKWGELILTYGITGVPTINAFQMKSEPRPQDLCTNGMMLAFWGDIEFKQWNELNDWLRSKGRNPEDPKNAIGYVPLGILEGIEEIDRKKVLEAISKHPSVTGFSLVQSPLPAPKPADVRIAEAKWPADPEIFYHLDLCPYIDLNVKFDAKKLYEEAHKARDYFVAHRDYDQSGKDTGGKWKSLSLQGLFGDYTKTQYHTSYEFEGKPYYKETVFAQLCPETMKFISSITDLDKCERVRYMLLEPGASVRVHRDNNEWDTCLAVNISLNMPEGCVFYAQLMPDGSEHPYSVTLPFKDSGSVLLFNNAKYHKVVNNSDVPRIHMIFHGPIKFSDDQLIKLARAQNGITDSQDLLRKLAYKKNFMGEELTKTKSFFNDWFLTGLRDNSLPSNYALAVYDHQQYFADESNETHLKKRTIPTLFPLKYDLIKENEWDSYLKKSFIEGKEFAVIAAAGTFFFNLHVFIQHLVINAQELKKKKWPLAGHIMDFNDGKRLPYFHEQFLIVNLKAWHELGEPSLGTIYGTEQGTLKDAEISTENIHDHYTPHFIKSSSEKANQVVRTGVHSWGSDVIIKAIDRGLGVLNINEGVRKEKKYSYPRDEIKQPKEDIEKTVHDRLNFSRKEVFYFNNEPLTVLNIENFQPKKLISVAAGFKPYQIIHQYGMNKDLEMKFIDFSPNALEYQKRVVKSQTLQELINQVSWCMENGEIKKSADVEGQLKGIVRSYFNGDTDALMDSIRKAKDAQFQEVNLVSDEHSLSSLINSDDKFAIWISNAFYNNSLFLLKTPEEAEERLLAVVKSIAQKINKKVFRHGQTFLFGDNLKSISGFLTDGVVTNLPLSLEYWNLIS